MIYSKLVSLVIYFIIFSSTKKSCKFALTCIVFDSSLALVKWHCKLCGIYLLCGILRCHKKAKKALQQPRTSLNPQIQALKVSVSAWRSFFRLKSSQAFVLTCFKHCSCVESSGCVMLNPMSLTLLNRIMGAYKYINELYKKKQSDVLRFLLRVRWVSVFLYIWNCLRSQADVGSTDSSTSFIEHPVLRDQTKLDVWDTRRSRGIWYTESVCAEATGRSPFPKVMQEFPYFLKGCSWSWWF